MLIIRHRTGPLAGKEERPTGRDPNRIVFGRDPAAADVVYPPDAREVSRQHFALVRRGANHWTFDLFGQPFVAVNGEPADVGAPVRSGSIIELGHRGGPSFEVTVEGDIAVDTMQTLPQEQFVGARGAAMQAAASANRARKVALGGVAVAIIVALGATFFIWQRGAADREFARQIDQLRTEQARLVADSIPREHRDRLAKSAFLVIHRDATGKETWGGTTFPLSEDMVGTVAHVAEVKNGLAPGENLFVREPGMNGRTWEVTEIKVHPGYYALHTFLQEDPLLVETIKRPDNPFGADFLTSGNSYDVAYMKVKGPPLPKPYVEIASPEDLLKLSQGDPLAYAGYPSEHIIGVEVGKLAPNPQVRTGAVTAITDLFTMPTEPAFRRLVHHNLGTTVGTSGSPIIGANGKLVALHNRSNYIETSPGKQIPIGVVAFAQRADMLRELIAGEAEKVS